MLRADLTLECLVEFLGFIALICISILEVLWFFGWCLTDLLLAGSYWWLGGVDCDYCGFEGGCFCVCAAETCYFV